MTTTPRTAPDTLAPHVDRAWLDAFVVELRLQDVPGDRIGDALAEVDAHCVDSGEGAPAAFGDPVGYARSLALAPDARSAGDVRRVVGAVATQLVGLALVPTSVAALLRGDQVAIAGGTLLAAVLALAATGSLALAPGRALRLVLDRPVVAWVCLVSTSVAVALPALLWRSTLLTLPAAAVAAVGAAALVAGTAIGRAALGEDDPVVAPAAVDAPVARSSTRWPALAPLLLVPAATVLLSAGLVLAGL